MTDLGNNLIAISVPEDAKASKQFYGQECLTIQSSNPVTVQCIGLDFEFEILGTVTASDIDFDVEPYVKCVAEYLGGKFYKNYIVSTPCPVDYLMTKPEESFRSLLSSKELFFENPMPKPEKQEYRSMVYAIKYPIWKQSQNNLIEKLVIIKKV